MVNNGLTIQYQDISTTKDFYNWSFGVLVPGLFASFNQSVSSEVLTVKYNQVGGIRFRQVRVRPDSCSVLNYQTGEVYSKDDSDCYADYTEAVKSKDSFSIGMQQCSDNSQSCRMRQAFRYTENIPNSSAVSGSIASYGSTGFYIDSEVFLDDNKLTVTDLQTMIAFLRTNNWIDVQTRAVIITFITWNMNYEYFTQVQFIVEFGASSVIIPKYSIETLNIIPFMSSWLKAKETVRDFFLKFPELYVFIFSWLGLLIPMLVRFLMKPKAFIKVMWNYIDLILFVLMQGQIIVKVYLYFVAEEIYNTLNTRNFNVFLNLNTPLLAISILGNLESYATLLAAIKLLSYFQLSSMTMIWDTLERGSRSIFAFMIILVLLLNAFTQMGHIVYGSAVESFATYFRSLISLFRMLLGDISRYPDMSNAEPNFTPFIFIGYIFLCFFVMINIFVAILNEAFGVVVDYRQQNKDAAKMQKFGKKLLEEVTYFWRRGAMCIKDCWKKSKNPPMSQTLRKLKN